MLYIMRGPPGSGKSTIAKEIATKTGARIASADFFHLNEKGEYEWKPENVASAHAWCRGLVEGILSCDEDCVLDNTNIIINHFLPYVKLADKYGHLWCIIVPNTPWAWNVVECAKRNTHSVPEATIARMIKDYQVHKFDKKWVGLNEGHS